MTYRRIITLLILLLAPMALIAADDKPEQVLETNVAKVVDTLKQHDGKLDNNPEKLKSVVDNLILPLIDFEAMSKLTLAKYWRRASPEQQQQFMAAYKSMLIRTYTNSLAEYAGQDIRFFPDRTRLDGKYAEVYSVFVPGSGQPNRDVKYSMRESDGRWLVYDITIDGLSFIKNYRTSFGREINNHGLDALIQRLQQGEDFS